MESIRSCSRWVFKGPELPVGLGKVTVTHPTCYRGGRKQWFQLIIGIVAILKIILIFDIGLHYKSDCPKLSSKTDSHRLIKLYRCDIYEVVRRCATP